MALHTLDEILGERSVLAENVRPLATARADDLSLELVDFGVKDIILPGDMKLLLNKVIEAQKTAEANVILRREETAAVELESYKELADKVGTLNVVMGGDGVAKIDLRGWNKST